MATAPVTCSPPSVHVPVHVPDVALIVAGSLAFKIVLAGAPVGSVSETQVPPAGMPIVVTGFVTGTVRLCVCPLASVIAALRWRCWPKRSG